MRPWPSPLSLPTHQSSQTGTKGDAYIVTKIDASKVREAVSWVPGMSASFYCAGCETQLALIAPRFQASELGQWIPEDQKSRYQS